MTDPAKAMDELETLRKRLNVFAYNLDGECEDIAEQWKGLGRVGGQRADHAALLLSRLRSHLADIAKFCKTVEAQIDAMVADPFERNVKNEG